MVLTNVVPLTEAAAFTLGCALLQTRRFDPNRVGVVLACVATLLIVLLLIAITPDNPGLDDLTIDPWSL
jgi:hypothetical protein